jgi:hypothetical protein
MIILHQIAGERQAMGPEIKLGKSRKHAARNRKRYFKGMFVVGKGPVIEQ